MLALGGAIGEQVDVDFVSAELGAAQADLGKIEGAGCAGGAADGDDGAVAVAMTLYEDVVGTFHGGAIKQVIDRMDVAGARSAGPEKKWGFVSRGDFRMGRARLGVIAVGRSPVVT